MISTNINKNGQIFSPKETEKRTQQAIPFNTFIMRLRSISLLFCLLTTVLCVFNIADVGQSGLPMNKQPCNASTILQFSFHSTSALEGTISTDKGRRSNINSSSMDFIDIFGDELHLHLNDYAFQNTAVSAVRGYSNDSLITADVIFHYLDGPRQLYLYIPFTADLNASFYADVIDLTSQKSPIPGLANFNGDVILSQFNFLDQTDYNQWYSMQIQDTTFLISKFIYQIKSTQNALTLPIAPAAQFNTLIYTLTPRIAAQTGNKLCYASFSNGNFQNQMRSNVGLWFIVVMVFVYWMCYLHMEGNTKSVFDRQKFNKNQWTKWSLYSIFNVAHQEFFPRLIRMTVVLLQWSLQGFVIACLISTQYATGDGIVVWAAVSAWALTLPFPMLQGYFMLKKLYWNLMTKWDLISLLQDERISPRRQEQYKQQLYKSKVMIFTYSYWFYCGCLVLCLISWAITISRLQTLARSLYIYQWYWLKSMFVVFFFEYFICEPLLILAFRFTPAIIRRGGFYYDMRLGQKYQEALQ